MKITMKSFKDRYFITIYVDDSWFGFIDCQGVDFEYPENIIGVDKI